MAEAAAFEQIYAYPFASDISSAEARTKLSLAASRAPQSEPLFFHGALKEPELAAALLLAVSEVALRRFYTPPAMVARILRAADPVVSADGERLRFESFSQCCGVHARADFLPEMLTAESFGKGTTNVDFNPTMRAALSRARPRDAFELRVSAEQVAVTSAAVTTIERKVKLPARWLRGFGEAQALATSMKLAATLNGPQSRRFLAGLPSQVKARDGAWLLPTPDGLRLSQQPDDRAISCAGLGRLAVMKPLARFAAALRVYAGAHGSSAFELDFGAARFMVALSAAPARGFSGEGQLLLALGAKDAGDALARVRSRLAWGVDVDPPTLAREFEIPVATAAAALQMLAARGLVGFDPREQRYFHRELPFDLSLVEAAHPRLVDARALLAAGAVAFAPSDGRGLVATVRGPDVEHRVRLAGAEFHCTCLWHARTAGESGPCKHVLAATIANAAAAAP